MADVIDIAAHSAWRDRLQRSSTGAIRPNLYNAITAVRGSRIVSGRFYWDEFRARVMVSGELPWSDDDGTRAWSDNDDVRFTEFLQATDVQLTIDVVQRAVGAVAMEQKTHPLREWIGSLKWDGVSRISDWLTFYLGVQKTAYSQAVGEAWLISAVARIMQPGCKADGVLILEGAQGIGKSTAMRILAGNEYFTDEISDLGSKDAAVQMQGAWIIELAELDSLSRSAVERTKAFLSRTTDRYVPKYERRVVDQPRQCVFVGTSNNVEFRDETGNRRFWPVVAQHVDQDALREERDQIWAEAVSSYRSGAPWWLTDVDVIKESVDEQADRLQTDPWDDVIAEWLSGRDSATVQVILSEAIKLSTDRQTRGDEMRVSKRLKGLGWSRKKITIGGRRSWHYARPVA